MSKLVDLLQFRRKKDALEAKRQHEEISSYVPMMEHEKAEQKARARYVRGDGLINSIMQAQRKSAQYKKNRANGLKAAKAKANKAEAHRKGWLGWCHDRMRANPKLADYTLRRAAEEIPGATITPTEEGYTFEYRPQEK